MKIAFCLLRSVYGSRWCVPLLFRLLQTTDCFVTSRTSMWVRLDSWHSGADWLIMCRSDDQLLTLASMHMSRMLTISSAIASSQLGLLDRAFFSVSKAEGESAERGTSLRFSLGTTWTGDTGTRWRQKGGVLFLRSLLLTTPGPLRTLLWAVIQDHGPLADCADPCPSFVMPMSFYMCPYCKLTSLQQTSLSCLQKRRYLLFS